MAHMILVDELVRKGVPLVEALEKQERWAERDRDLTPEEQMVRRNQRMMMKWERAQREERQPVQPTRRTTAPPRAPRRRGGRG